MNWTMPYPWRSRRDSVRRINMSSEPSSESFFCALRPIPRILSLRRQDYSSQAQIGVAGGIIEGLRIGGENGTNSKGICTVTSVMKQSGTSVRQTSVCSTESIGTSKVVLVLLFTTSWPDLLAARGVSKE